jgi:D-aspartate ligase
MMKTNTRTPVIVLASPHHGGLGVTRSLGRLGIPVFNVESNRWAPALFSRYSRGKFVWDLDTAPPERSVEYLAEVARKLGGRCILIPTTDRTAVFVADHAAALNEWYLFPAQSREQVRALSSKKEMNRLAGMFHIPTPKTLYPQTRADLLECVKSLDFPVMIKAVDCLPRKRDSKAKLIIRTRRDLFEVYDWIGEAAVRDLIVQEYIPGGEDAVWMFNGYFNQRSECLAGFTGKKLRQCPLYTGVASLGICQDNPAVSTAAGRFMQAVGYRGVVDMDFRFDARDGQYKLLDVNPRIGSTFRLFVSEAGMDVARALYLDLTGQPVAPAHAPDGRKWMVEDLDLVAAFRYCRSGRLRVREWLRSLRGIRETAFFAPDDLLPLLLMLRADASELLHRVKPRWDPVLPFLNKHRATDFQL